MSPEGLPALVVQERGAIEADELESVVGHRVDAVTAAVGEAGWWISETLLAAAGRAALDATAAHHREHALEPGAPTPAIRGAVARALPASARGAAEAVVQALVGRGSLIREGATVRLPEHRPVVEERRRDLERVADAVASGEPTPPSIAELVASGHPRSVIDAAVRNGMLVRIAPDLVVSPAFLGRAVDEIRSAGTSGMTVSAIRERLGTSRKYAVPLVEYLDQRGLTARRGDVRIARSASG